MIGVVTSRHEADHIATKENILPAIVTASFVSTPGGIGKGASVPEMSYFEEVKGLRKLRAYHSLAKLKSCREDGYISVKQ